MRYLSLFFKTMLFPAAWSDSPADLDALREQLRHLEGLRAIVRYKSTDDKQFAGKVTSLELREDIPAAPASASTKKNCQEFRAQLKLSKTRILRAGGFVYSEEP